MSNRLTLEEQKLPEGMQFCRKGLYDVQVELGYGVVKDGVEQEPTRGQNILEQNNWTASEAKPYILTGTVGERWVVKPSNLSAYDIDINDIPRDGTPITMSTKDPSNQAFMVAQQIPADQSFRVVPSWGFGPNGLDESQIMQANAKDSQVSHQNGDWVVALDARDVDMAKFAEKYPQEMLQQLFKENGEMKQFMELPTEIRETQMAAEVYDPRIINGSIMETTYDHADTKSEIAHKDMREAVLYHDDVKMATIDITGHSFEEVAEVCNNFKDAIDYYGDWQTPLNTTKQSLEDFADMMQTCEFSQGIVIEHSAMEPVMEFIQEPNIDIMESAQELDIDAPAIGE